MTTSNRYTCKKCSATFRLDRWSQCSNCGENVPEEFRVSSTPERARKPQDWGSLVDLPETSSVSNSRRLSSPKPKSNINSEQPIVDIKSLVDAQNRTTFAVRSLALYLFISLQSALFGGGMIGLAINNTSNYDEYGALNSGASFFVTLGALIVFAGFVVSIVVGRWELDKSKVSSRSSQY